MNKTKTLRILYHLTIICAGFTTLALEIIASRIMSPLFGASLDVWGAVLVVSLASLALGYYSGERIVRRKSVEMLPNTYVVRAFSSVLLACLGVLLFYPIIQYFDVFSVAVGAFLAASIIVFPVFYFTASLTPILVMIETITEQSQGGSRAVANGRTGQILAESTIGSVVGALVCVYVLIPAMPIEMALAYIIAPLFLSASLLFVMHRRFMSKSGRVIQLLALFVCAGLVFAGLYADAKPITMSGKLAEQEAVLRTGYGTVRVLRFKLPNENIIWRYLLIDGRTQDILSDDGQNVGAYTNAAVNMLVNYPKKISSVLLLGGGAAVIARDLSETGISVDVVDIIPGFEELSKKHFSMNDKVNFITSDARVFLNRCSKKYDAIVFDVFDGYGAPEHLITKEAFEAAKGCLNSDGLVSVNMLRDPDNAGPDSIVSATLSSVFSYVDLYAPLRTSFPIANGLWVASNASLAPLKLYGGKEPIYVEKDLKENWGFMPVPSGEEVSTDSYPVYVFKSKELFQKEHAYTRDVYGIDVMKP